MKSRLLCFCCMIITSKLALSLDNNLMSITDLSFNGYCFQSSNSFHRGDGTRVINVLSQGDVNYEWLHNLGNGKYERDKEYDQVKSVLHDAKYDANTDYCTPYMNQMSVQESESQIRC